MPNAQEWLEKYYPKDGTCLRRNESGDFINNFGKKRNEIILLFVSEQNLTGTLDLTDFINLKGLDCSDNKITELILKDNGNLEAIICYKNQLTNLVLPNNDKLSNLNCRDNKLINLDLSGCVNLQNLNCSNNQLTNLNLPISKQSNSTGLNHRVSNNVVGDHFPLKNYLVKFDIFSPRTELNVFSHLVNLTHLSIGSRDGWMKTNLGNQFSGSLEPLQYLTKLEHLDIQNLNILINFQYLPNSLQNLTCTGRMWGELALYGQNLQLWQAYHPYLMKAIGKEIIKLTDINFQFKKQIRTPLKIISRLAETTDCDWQFQYYYLFFSDLHLFSWEYNNTPESKLSEKHSAPENKIFWEKNTSLKSNISGEWETSENNSIFSKSDSKNKNLLKNDSINNSTKQLPLRLYNLETKQVINSKNLSDLNNYLTLSYCWGIDWENNPQSYGQEYLTDLTELGRKALNKVHATYQLLKKDNPNFPDYIWIDNLCINQSDQVEKGEEVSKQKNYYSNSTLTLIAIDEWLEDIEEDIWDELELTEMIILKIINSPWFHRSWTFQEGLLSKQTIFMFDNHLINGRKLALAWGGKLSTYNQLSHTFITPLGWSYHNEITQTSYSYDILLSKATNLTLGEALHAISHREQTILLDSIYSILGLLSYGEKITTHYKTTNDYTVKDLENKLAELIKQAYLYNPKEIITYLGERNPNNWWLPKINENGSFNILSSLNSDERVYQHFLLQIQQITKQGIALKGHYTLLNDAQIIELDCYDSRSNTNWNVTLQFTLNKSKQLIAIEQVDEWHYSANQERNPQELFIDMFNYEVIEKTVQPERYEELCYKLLVDYAKDKSVVQQAEFKHFLTLTTLDLANLNLTGNLDLSELVSLEELYCHNNKITELILPLNNKLKEIEASDCLLTNFNYATLNSTTLTRLDISDNNLPTTDVIVFSLLINLELLWIGNSYKKRIRNNIYNRFFGSLESFKVLTKLKSIEISNTDINSGVKFLPSSITEIHYSTKERPHCQLKLIERKITEWLEKKQLTNEIRQLEEIVEDLEIN